MGGTARRIEPASRIPYELMVAPIRRCVWARIAAIHICAFPSIHQIGRVVSSLLHRSNGHGKFADMLVVLEESMRLNNPAAEAISIYRAAERSSAGGGTASVVQARRQPFVEKDPYWEFLSKDETYFMAARCEQGWGAANHGMTPRLPPPGGRESRHGERNA
jgi:hypothetical protein